MNQAMLDLSCLPSKSVHSSERDLSSEMMKNDWLLEDVFNEPLSTPDLTRVFDGSQSIAQSQWNTISYLLKDTDNTIPPDLNQECHSTSFSFLAEELTKDCSSDSFFDPNALMSPLALNCDSTSSSDDLCSLTKSPEPILENKQTATDQIQFPYSVQDNENRTLHGYEQYQKFIPIKPKMENQDDQGREKQDCVFHVHKREHSTGSAAIAKTVDNHQAKNQKFCKDFQEKVLKRQQRVVRNRESALHSRKKKKEMMQTLEVTVNTLSSLNSQLKVENDSLKETIRRLEMENWELKSRKLINVPDLAKKTSCVLVVFVFLAINLKHTSFSTTLNSADVYKVPLRHGRLLLEYDKRNAVEKNFIFRNTAYDQDSASFHPKSGVASLIDKHVGKRLKNGERRLLKKKKEEDLKKNKTFVDELPCPSNFNETELFRLNEALDTLVKMRQGPQKKSKRDKMAKQVKNLFGEGKSRKKSLNCSANCTSNDVGKNALKKHQRKRQEARIKKNHQTQNEIQIFQHEWSGLNMLQKAIDRKPDTFYVMSFRKDQIIFPATQVNNTQRPRLSFILPVLNQSSWNQTVDQISMVQIDCQVIDTKTLQISKPDAKLHFPNRV